MTFTKKIVKREKQSLDLSYEEALEKGFITLKEAAELSKYSSDYIGQLIRAGKLEGEQVYSNVAWVTTEEAVRAYIQAKGKRFTNSASDTNKTSFIESPYMTYATRLFIVLMGVILLLLMYVFSVSLDQALLKNVAVQSEDTTFEFTYE